MGRVGALQPSQRNDNSHRGYFLRSCIIHCIEVLTGARCTSSIVFLRTFFAHFIRMVLARLLQMDTSWNSRPVYNSVLIPLNNTYELKILFHNLNSKILHPN